MSTDARGRHEAPTAPVEGVVPNPPYAGRGDYARTDQELIRLAPTSPAEGFAGEVATGTVVVDPKKSRFTTGQKVTAVGLAGVTLLVGFGASQVDWDKFFGDQSVGAPDGGFGGDDPGDNPDGVGNPNTDPGAPLHPMFQDVEGGNPVVAPGIVDMFEDGSNTDRVQNMVSVLLGTSANDIINGGDNNIVVSEGETHQYGYTQQFELDGNPDKSFTISVMQPSGDFFDDLEQRAQLGEVLNVPVDAASPDPDDSYYYDTVNDVIHYFHNHFPLEDGTTASVVFTISVSGGAHGELGQYVSYYADDPTDLILAMDKYVTPVFNYRDQYFGDGGGLG